MAALSAQQTWMYDLVEGRFRTRKLMAAALNYPYKQAIGPQTVLAVAAKQEVRPW